MARVGSLPLEVRRHLSSHPRRDAIPGLKLVPQLPGSLFLLPHHIQSVCSHPSCVLRTCRISSPENLFSPLTQTTAWMNLANAMLSIRSFKTGASNSFSEMPYNILDKKISEKPFQLSDFIIISLSSSPSDFKIVSFEGILLLSSWKGTSNNVTCLIVPECSKKLKNATYACFQVIIPYRSKL